ncbi:MAG: ABC transporter permease subunit [Bacteroidales bacterium]|nr:ABC transporter permease subunit [Bacteroidales bacterium]MDE7071788.1 ABC transporter permease subunit [Bacteroidales bacterium]
MELDAMNEKRTLVKQREKSARTGGKLAEEVFCRTLMNIASILIVGVMGVILVSIFYKGISTFSWNMLAEDMGSGFYLNRGGGIRNAILGSVYLSVSATLLALVIGLACSVCMNVYMVRCPRLLHTARFLLDLIWGVPSIIYGAFGFSLMVFFGLKTSLLAGIITVTLFILPIMIRAIDEVMKTVPHGLSESVLAMGSTRSELSYKVYLRQCFPGIVTAVLLAFGRAIGDAASVLYVTGESARSPRGLMDNVTTLPVAIYNQINSPSAAIQDKAYASAFILTLVILIISLLSRYISKRYQKYRIY